MNSNITTENTEKNVRDILSKKYGTIQTGGKGSVRRKKKIKSNSISKKTSEEEKQFNKIISNINILIKNEVNNENLSLLNLYLEDYFFDVFSDLRKKDIRKLISAIENSIIEFLKIYKINAKKDKKNIGIWVKNKKIAAIGLRVSRWIAFHGCSINISNNLSEYLKIIPCGLDNKKVTSIYNEKNINPINYKKKLANIFIKNINNI